jgi:hypothetical protein
MKTVLVFLFIFCLCASLKCNKDKATTNVLPLPTQEGRNTFGSKLNDSLWISDPGMYWMGANLHHDTLGIEGSRKNPDKSIENILIELVSTFDYKKTTYPLNDTIHSFAVYMVTGSSNCIGRVYGYGGGGEKKSANGLLTLSKVDTINKIISGTFSFTVATDYCDTFRFTDGRFDLKLQ